MQGVLKATSVLYFKDCWIKVSCLAKTHLLLKPECYVVLKSMLYWIAHQIYALMVGSGKIARKTSLFRIKGIVIAGVRYYLFNMSHLLVTKGGLFAWI